MVKKMLPYLRKFQICYSAESGTNKVGKPELSVSTVAFISYRLVLNADMPSSPNGHRKVDWTFVVSGVVTEENNAAGW